MSLIKILKEDFGTINDPTIKRIVNKLEDRTDYTLHHEKELSQIGYGASAEVFEVMGTGKVLRFGNTSDRGSYNRTEMDRMVKKDFNHVVNYYYYKEFNGSEVAVMEKLERLNKDFAYTIDLISNDYPDGLYYFLHYVDPEDPEDIREALDRENEELVEMILNHSDELNQIYKGIKELESVGMRHEDLRRHNIMQDPRTSDIKIIDIT